MEELKQRFESTQQAHSTLAESVELFFDPNCNNLHDQLRDSVIKRFEYSLDTFWKYLRVLLEEKYKIMFDGVISPRSIFRAGLNAGIIKDEEFSVCLSMVGDRNLTSHTYNEELAESISKRIKIYHEVMCAILARDKCL